MSGGNSTGQMEKARKGKEPQARAERDLESHWSEYTEAPPPPVLLQIKGKKVTP